MQYSAITFNYREFLKLSAYCKYKYGCISVDSSIAACP